MTRTLEGRMRDDRVGGGSACKRRNSEKRREKDEERNAVMTSA